MKNFLLIALTSILLAAGCGLDHMTAPETQRSTWSLVRFHENENQEGGDSAFLDLSIEADGTLTLVDGRGKSTSFRGLLAGENLETLTRLIGGLPPQSYAPPIPCTPDGFFVSVTRGGRVLTYASGPCDAGAPEDLLRTHELLKGVAQVAREPRVLAAPYQVLIAGTLCAIHDAKRVVIEDLDSLLRLLQATSPDRPVVVPRVDFRRQVVVAEFLGDRPSAGFGLSVDGVEKTDSGWVRIHLRMEGPGPGCGVAQVVTQPFLFVAVERSQGGVLVDSELLTTRCD